MNIHVIFGLSVSQRYTGTQIPQNMDGFQEGRRKKEGGRGKERGLYFE
jgi:hypothetical protein